MFLRKVVSDLQNWVERLQNVAAYLRATWWDLVVLRPLHQALL